MVEARRHSAWAGDDVNEDRVLNSDEAAALVGMTKAWVEEKSRQGLFPGFKPGGGRYWRYFRESVLEWLREQEREQVMPRARPRPSNRKNDVT